MSRSLRTTVIGSYPFPAWLEIATAHLDALGTDDLAEMLDDAVSIAIKDQVDAGLDTISDGEQTRLDFNLSFYGFLDGLAAEPPSPRRFGPPGHDQRAKHAVIGELGAPRGLGTVEDFRRLNRLAPAGVGLRASVPGPYTLSGRLVPNRQYPDRLALAQALVPIVRQELEALVAAGCQDICVDEPSMSCYAHREDPRRFVAMFNDTVEGVRGRTRVSTHLCFGNYKGRAVAPRSYAAMFPAFLDLHVDEVHLEMASRQFAELELIGPIAQRMDVAVGIIDVKNYYVETADDVAASVRRCLAYVPAERLAFAPDCGLSQTARWAARRKLVALVEGVQRVRADLGIA
ncbi:MAG: methionine synthase [Acidobacteria bacterium]|nr:methionine synthase [Acidobacteriota bacterium]